MPKQKPRKLVAENVLLKHMDTFSLDYLDIDKMLRGLKSRSSLRADIRTKVNRLASYIDSKLSELAQQAAANHAELDSLRKMKKILLEIQMSEQYEYWYEHFKKLDEEARQLSDTALSRQTAAIEQLLNQVCQETERWHAQLLFEASEKIRLAERNEVEELIKHANERMQKHWDNIERFTEEIRFEAEKVHQIEEEIYASGFLEKLHELNPSKSVELLRSNFKKCKYVDNQNLETTDRFLDEFCRMSDLDRGQTEDVIDNLGIRDKFQKREEGINRINIVESRMFEEYGRLIVGLQNNLVILGAKSAEDRDRFIEDQSERIAKLPPQVFTDLFDQGIRDIETTGQEQPESRAVLVDRLNNLLHIFKCRFGETSDEYLVAKSRLESLVTPEGRPKSINVKRSIPLWMMTRSQGGTQEVVQPSEPLPQQDRSIPTIRETQVEPSRQLQEISDQAADTSKPKEEEEHDSSLNLESIGKEIERLEADIKLLTGQLQSASKTERLAIASEIKRKKSERDTLKSQTVQGSVQTPVVNVDDQDRHGEYP